MVLRPMLPHHGNLIFPSPPVSGGEGGENPSKKFPVFARLLTPSPPPLSPEAGERGAGHRPLPRVAFIAAGVTGVVLASWCLAADRTASVQNSTALATRIDHRIDQRLAEEN